MTELCAPEGYELHVDTEDDGLSAPWDLRQTEPPPERKEPGSKEPTCSWCGARIRGRKITLIPKEGCPRCPIRARVEKMLAKRPPKQPAHAPAPPERAEAKQRAGERDYRNGYAAGKEDERHFTIRLLRAWQRDAAKVGWPDACQKMLRLAVRTLEEEGHRPPKSGATGARVVRGGRTA